METFSSLATEDSASVEGPGMVSAKSNSAAFSSRQKYWLRNNSCKQTTSAPFAAASRIPAIALLKFVSGSVDQLICTSPMLNFESRRAPGAIIAVGMIRSVRSMIGSLLALHVNPAVHVENVPGDETGLFADQKLHRTRDVFRRTHAFQRRIADHLLLQFLAEPGRHIRPDKS